MQCGGINLAIGGQKHQVGYWRPEPVKLKIRGHRGGSGKQRVGLGEVSLQRHTQILTLQPTSVPPSDRELAGLHRVASLWRATSAIFVGVGQLAIKDFSPQKDQLPDNLKIPDGIHTITFSSKPISGSHLRKFHLV